MRTSLLFCFAAIFVSVSGQNLVNNSSFEIVTAEPFYGCEFTNATGWLNPSGAGCPANLMATPDLFSMFSTGQADLPASFMGTTTPHTGDRIAGLVTYHLQLANYREYFMTQLACPLIAGQTYTVSFWTTGGSPVQYIYHTNNIEVYFHNTPLTQTNYDLIPGITPQLSLTTVIANSSWTYYSFSFTPTQSYAYMSIGNFKNDANTTVQTFGTNRPYAYYFFDDISVVPSSNPLTLGNDTSYCSAFSRTLSTGDPSTVWSTGVTASQIVVTTPGTYYATISNACGSWSDTIQLSQNTPPPPFSLGNDSAYCGSFSRTLNTGNSSTVWSTGVTAAQITINSPGTYSASISNVCGTATDTIVFSQTIPFTVNIGNDTAVCTGQTVTLNAGNPGAVYSWSTGANTQTISAGLAGIYWVDVSLNGCTIRDSAAVTALTAPPAFSLGNDTSYCGSFSRTLNTGNSNTIWSTGVTAAQITVNSPGTYTASISNICGTATDTIIISQTIPFTVNIGNDTTVCIGQTVTIDAGNPGVVFNWSTGAGTQSISVTTAGIYWVDVSQAGCTIRDSVSISTITPPAAFSLGVDTLYCGNFTRVLFTGNSNTVWSTGATAPQISVSAPGTYYTTITNACGTQSDTIVIQQQAAPLVNIGPDTTLCANESLILSSPLSTGNFLWNDGSVGASITTTGTGIYWLEVSQAGCSVRDSIIISAASGPQFSLGPDTVLCGNSLTLSVNLSGVQYLWQNNSTDSFYTVTGSGAYSVTVSNSCGSSSDQIQVELHTDACFMAVPTAFTPNNDGINDIFRGISRCRVANYLLRVYNRWGEMVFESTDVADGWNGVFRNHAQPLGVFVYYMEYFNECENALKKMQGNVTLVR